MLNGEKMKTTRPRLTTTNINEAHLRIETARNARLQQKGLGVFVSRHEALGVITEEYKELIDAIHKKLHHNEIRNELIDIAVACEIAIASLEDMDW